MTQLAKRIMVLEAQSPTDKGRCHRVIQHVGVTQEAAIDNYGRHRIGDNDRIIVRQIISAPTVEIVS